MELVSVNLVVVPCLPGLPEFPRRKPYILDSRGLNRTQAQSSRTLKLNCVTWQFTHTRAHTLSTVSTVAVGIESRWSRACSTEASGILAEESLNVSILLKVPFTAPWWEVKERSLGMERVREAGRS